MFQINNFKTFALVALCKICFSCTMQNLLQLHYAKFDPKVDIGKKEPNTHQFNTHYYSQGLVFGAGILTKATIWLYRPSQYQVLLLWVSPLTVSYLISPLVTSFCKHKSSRLCAVLGGIVLSLGTLFNSFAREYHQVLIR